MNEKKKQKLIEVVRTAAEEYGWRFRDDYSGRGMCGAACVGVVVSRHDDAEARTLFRDLPVRVDSMGLDIIVYWPDLETRARPATTT